MSWYPSVSLQNREIKYLKTIQNIFKLQDTTRRWKDFKLEPHQMEWHRDDIAIQGYNAKSRVVVKSRNTSFTTDSHISNLMSVGHYSNQVLPFVRLNKDRAFDLITECKDIIRNMKKVIKLPDGRYYPFNPEMVNMEAKGHIFFEDRGVEFRAFPATASSSEIIRGLRIAGSGGVIDESNFCRDYENIYIALRDAAAGTDRLGRKYFQLNIGTTLKGTGTPFKLWFDKLTKSTQTKIKIYRWPVFDPEKFNKNISPLKQNLIPIVHWHDLQDLHDNWDENLLRFMEEYMAIAVDSDNVLYPQGLVLRCIDTELKNQVVPQDKDGEYIGAVDPAGEGTDFFSVSIFEKKGDLLEQRYLFYKRVSDIEEDVEFCDRLIRLWNFTKFRVDANNLGYQLGQTLQKRYPSVVELIRGRVSVKIDKKQSIPLKEFMHTNQKNLMRQGKVKYLNDELQIIHFSMWDGTYEADHNKEYGHGDSTISNALALLPYNWRQGSRVFEVSSNIQKEAEGYDTKEKVKEFNNMSMKNRMRFYKK